MVTSLRQRKNAILLGLAIVFLALFIYSSVIRPLLEPLIEEIAKAGGNTYQLPRITGAISPLTNCACDYSGDAVMEVLGPQAF
jgi:hypothetical protein